jgi:predicted kinase
MGKPRLVIICGVPGSGKSTFAFRAADRWGAVRFASETFAEELGALARTASGDLSKEAITHAYAAMGAAATHTLANGKLTVVVGSFRSEELRRRFRDIAKNGGASATTLRIACSANTAAERVRARLALGERGPSQEMIVKIGAELDRAHDIDAVLYNDLSLQHFHQQIDAVMHIIVESFDNDACATNIARRLEQLGRDELLFAPEFAETRTNNQSD